jgi:hypothetical protein
VELEVALVLVEHAIEPGQELLGAVVGVKDDGDAVDGSNTADVVGSGNGAGNGGSLAIVAHTLTGEESGTTLRNLQDDGAVLVASSLEGSDDGGGGGNVLYQVSLRVHTFTRESGESRDGGTYDGGESELLLLSVLEETENVVTDDDTGLAVKLLKDTHDDCSDDKKCSSGKREEGREKSVSP